MPKKYTKDTSNMEKASKAKPEETSNKNDSPISSPNDEGTVFKNLVAAIIALVFVAGIGYFAFTYFNGVVSLEDVYQQLSQNFSQISSNDEPTPQTPQIAGDSDDQNTQEETETDRNFLQRAGDILTGRSTQREGTESTEVPNSETPTTPQAVTPGSTEQGTVEGQESVFGQWIANDYKQGDISKGNYEVQDGDTLWEIAEGVYGNGGQWTEILNANPQQVGHLADGTQALIYPGQVLVIP